MPGDHIGPFTPPEPDYTPGELSPPRAVPEAGPEPILAQVRALMVAMTALIIAVNALLAGLASLRAGQQVRQVMTATEVNERKIEQVGRKADAMHREVRETLGNFGTPPAGSP